MYPSINQQIHSIDPEEFISSVPIIAFGKFPSPLEFLLHINLPGHFFPLHIIIPFRLPTHRRRLMISTPSNPLILEDWFLPITISDLILVITIVSHKLFSVNFEGQPTFRHSDALSFVHFLELGLLEVLGAFLYLLDDSEWGGFGLCERGRWMVGLYV